MKAEKIYEKIFVPLEGSELGESVLPHAENIATLCSGVEVILCVGAFN